MQRRKFIATVGSLAAGSAAAMGTGAFTTAEAERAVSVEVAGDKKAWIELSPESKYAKINDDDVLELDFSEHPDSVWANEENGINPKATYKFEDVFSIWTDRAAGHGSYNFYIEKSGFEGVDVTVESGGGNSNAQAEGTDLTETWTFNGGPMLMNVDITLESEGGAQSADGTLTIHAEEIDD